MRPEYTAASRDLKTPHSGYHLRNLVGRFAIGAYLQDMDRGRGHDDDQDQRPALDVASRIERWGRLLSVADLSDLIDQSQKQIYRLVHRHYIPALRIAGTIKFDPVATANWLRSQAI